MSGRFKKFIFFSPEKNELIMFSSCTLAFLKILDKYKVLYGTSLEELSSSLKIISKDEVIINLLSKYTVKGELQGKNIYIIEYKDNSCVIDLNTYKVSVGGSTVKINKNELKVSLDEFVKKYIPEYSLIRKGDYVVLYGS